ncbi:MAG: ParB N-terminal domain-containing protein [Acidobacteria bacterium]|nr:ParB N-terminal domain-containing protein [Acidobacteriota bacterium]
MIADRIRELRRVPAADLHPDPRNWRRHPKAQRAALQAVLEKIGFADAVLAREESGGRLVLIDGHLRADLVKRQDIPTLVLDVDEEEAAALLSTIDPLAAMAETDSEAWTALLEGMQADMRALAEATGPGHKVARLDSAAGALNERFVVPPFSVLDARQGYWRERKNAWLALGLESEAGRDGALIFHKARSGSASQRISGTAHGTSIFDPVLCELAYRWFTAPGARVLDPFAGGSVRGIVAAKLGRQYTGVDLRAEQVAENERQAEELLGENDPRPEWFAGDSREVVPGLDGSFDFVFSCPPYGDLETYSDDPADLSNMSHAAFLDAYREIIRAAVERLADDRFACFVVGDFRGESGVYRNFPAETIRAFLDAGTRLYNEAILATTVGSASLRAGGQFVKSRKLAKCHQNVLVFVKGDPKRATEWCGDIEVELPEADPDA